MPMQLKVDGCRDFFRLGIQVGPMLNLKMKRAKNFLARWICGGCQALDDNTNPMMLITLRQTMELYKDVTHE